MNKLLLLFLPIFAWNSALGTTTYTVGSSSDDFTTILDAYNACTASTDYIIELQSDYDYVTESTGGTAVLTLGVLSNKSASNTVTIRPAATLTLTCTASWMFILDGANWVIFDGRIGGAGSSELSLINSYTAAERGIFQFVNDASNNTLKYCLIKGGKTNASATITGSGLIFFNISGGGTGNDNNTIDHCMLRENTSLPIRIIYSTGTVGATNSGNIISNCDFINYRAAAVWLSTNSDTWSILNNHFYQTSSLSYSKTHSMIYILCGSGYTITGNFLGGQAQNCGGSAYDLTLSAVNTYFWAILFSSTTIAGTNTVSNNTISNFSISSITQHSTTPAISAIYTDGPGDFVIGSSGNGNTIGSTSGTGDITVTVNNSSGIYNPSFNAICVSSTGTSSVAYNSIGSINYSQTDATNDFDDIVSMIRVSSSGGTVIIDNNTIGNTTADNITSTSNSVSLNGIKINDNVPTSIVISNNTLQNFTVTDGSFGNTAKLYGIYHDNFDCPMSIYNNVIKTFSFNLSDPTSMVSYSDAQVVGIFGQTSASNSLNIYNNRITDLSSSYAGANLVYVTGMYLADYTSSTVNIYRNKIKSLSNASSNSMSGLVGMFIDGTASGSLLAYNNIIVLSDGANTVSKEVDGIVSNSNIALTEIYHNTIKLAVSYSSGTGISSALNLVPNSGNYQVKNNIFQNVSTGSGTHYAQNWSAVFGTTTNIRNNYNEAPNASKLVNWGGTDQTLAGWRTTISDGSNTEVDGGISISSSTGAPSSSSIVGSAGTPIGSVTVDYDLNARSVLNPWIGAFELITPLSVSLFSETVKCVKTKNDENKCSATINWTTMSENNNNYFTIERSEDGFSWEVKDTVKASGTSYQKTNYNYYDLFTNETPESKKTMYYRLSQTDFDGQIQTFDILSCTCEASEKIKLYPVPATESIVINFGDRNSIPNSFQIMDMYGRILEEVYLEGGELNTSYKLDISKYSSGRYLIRINDWKNPEDAVFIKK